MEAVVGAGPEIWKAKVYGWVTAASGTQARSVRVSTAVQPSWLRVTAGTCGRAVPFTVTADVVIADITSTVRGRTSARPGTPSCLLYTSDAADEEDSVDL